MRKVERSQVHLFSILGDRLMLDVTSGAVHRLDEVSFDVISALVEQTGLLNLRKIHGDVVVNEVLDEVSALREQGLFLGEPPAYPEISEAPIVKSLCMNIAHDCNLRCSYCFAGTGPYAGNNTRALMSEKVAHAAVDFILANSQERGTCEMDFFGGEPLMNMPVVRSAVKYARKREVETGKRFRFTLTTNATMLTEEIADFVDGEDMQVILSLDGRPSAHDRYRPFPDGSGSHEATLRKTLWFLERRKFKNYFVRGTYTRDNLDFVNDARYYLDHGIEAFSLEPVVASPSTPYSITMEHIPAIDAEYERLLTLYLDRWNEGRPFTFYHFEVDLSGGPCLKKRMSGCGAGREYLAVAPDGSLYPCHQFDGMTGFAMGNVLSSPDLAGGQAKFLAAGLAHKDECQNCWARYYCGGGCFAAAWERNHDLKVPDPVACAIQKRRLECAIYAQTGKEENRFARRSVTVLQQS